MKGARITVEMQGGVTKEHKITVESISAQSDWIDIDEYQ